MGRNRTRVSQASTGRLYRLSYHTEDVSTRRRRTDSNRRETALQAVASPLGHDAAISPKAPGEGVEPKPSPGSEPGVLPVRRPRTGITSCVAPVPSQSSVSVSCGCLPPAPEVPTSAPSSAGPRTPYGICASPPQLRQGFPGVPRRGLEPLLCCSRPGRASTSKPSNNEGRPCGSPSSPVRCRISSLLGRLHPRDEDIRIGLIGNTRESMLSPDRLITPASY